jgi:hypothetical protein
MIALCLKATNDTVLIGSTVVLVFAGHQTVFNVPGGIRVYFSGQRARAADIIQPDIPALPTIAGLREGSDEVLNRALECFATDGR